MNGNRELSVTSPQRKQGCRSWPLLALRAVISALVLLINVSHSHLVAAEELEGTVKVSGSKVQIHVQNKNGSPAAGVNVRLLYGRQQAVAVARTNDQGRWVHRVDQTGAYEAIVESGSNVLRLPFTVLNESSTVKFPWIILVPC